MDPCTHCPAPGIARHNDTLLCLAHWIQVSLLGEDMRAGDPDA